MKIHPSFVISRQAEFYSSFPAVASCEHGSFIVVFRRAPNYFGWPGTDENFRCHHDCTSQLMLVRSVDGGKIWSKPELLYAPPDGASQDGGLYFDGHYLYANSFIWQHVLPPLAAKLQAEGWGRFLEMPPRFTTPAFPQGVYMLRSSDGGKNWDGPFYPDSLPDGSCLLPGKPRRMHNRGNLITAPDGSLLWVGEQYENTPVLHADVLIYRSLDHGRSFHYLATAAKSRGTELYEEPFLCITPGGKYVILIRSQHPLPEGGLSRADLVTVESSDCGYTWSAPVRHSFHAEPCAAQRLPDGRTLILYSYRKPPYGVRGKIVSPEFEDLDSAPEFILRDDAPTIDVGYPWLTMAGANRVLAVYYIGNSAFPGAGGIEGNFIEIDN